MNTSRTNLAAWIVMLLPSTLSLIIWREIAGGEPDWWYLVPLTGLLLVLASTYLSDYMRDLRAYTALTLLLFIMGFGGGWTFGAIPWIRASPQWSNMISNLPAGFPDLAVHLLRLTPALIFLSISLLRGKNLRDLYLTRGEIYAAVKPTRLLGVKDNISWLNMTIRFSAVFGLGTLLFLILSARPDIGQIWGDLGVLPFAVLIAGLNAFNEEFTLRAAPMTTLRSFGDDDALALTTVFFALGHYYGVPYGLIGVLLSGFLGWFIGKGILETRGFLLAWFTHLVPDIVIFGFLLVYG
jgi:CAAX protease family protein